MAVYVDDMWETPLGNYRGMKMSHMVADTVEELHLMADKIGVQRRWYQGPPKSTNPHYDICLSKRKLAVAAGAKQVTVRQAVGIVAAMRDKAIADYVASKKALKK